MTIKTLEEIKAVLAKFPEASGVGYVIAPALIKIAIGVGLIGYKEALRNWEEGLVGDEKVYQPGENLPMYVPNVLLIDWDGPAIWRRIGGIQIGIKQTIENIEKIIAEPATDGQPAS